MTVDVAAHDENEGVKDEDPIRLVDVRYSVSDKKILKGISFNVKRSEILSVVGMSGCGKTSLLHCIGALNHASSGEIWIEGTQIVGLSERKLARSRERMGMVFQYAALFDSLSVFENVAFGLRRRRHLREEEIKTIVAEKLAVAAVPGTEALFPSQLSGGMAKRVGLARALALEPGILLFDEPTSGLDPVVATLIDELMVRTRDQLGVTSIVVSHNMPSVLRISDKVAMLHEGRLLAFGTPEEIANTSDPIVRQFIEGRSTGPIELARV